MAKTVLLGGGFDPPHLGHLEMAKAALRLPDVERVHLVPSWRPPHKSTLTASDTQRLEMCALLTENQPGFAVLPVEIEQRLSYTADSLRSLREQTPGTEFCLLLGSDAARSLRWWANADYIRNTTDLLVIPPQGEPIPELPGVRLLDASIPPVSSSEIRRRRACGESIHGLTTEAVEQYILSYRLYEED